MIFLAPQVDFGELKIITARWGMPRKNAARKRDDNLFKIQKY
jgi:hypothetical protein